MKKRVLSVLLAGAMIFSMTACGPAAQTPEPVSEAIQDPVEEEPVEEVEAQETEVETEEEAEAAEPATHHDGTPEICVWKKSWYETADDGTLLVKGSIGVPILTTDSADHFPELANALVQDAEDQRDAFSKSIVDYIAQAKSDYADSPDRFGDDGMYYSSEATVLMQRADNAVVSYFSSGSDFSGGAHGMYGLTGYSYDTQTGEKLMLTDVLTDTSGLNDILNDLLTVAYPDVQFDDLDEALASYDVAVDDVTPDADNDSGYHYPYDWALSANGIEFYFGPYALASYAEGAQQVTLSYSEYADIVNPDYVPDGSASYMVSFENSLGGYDIDGDESADEIDICFGYTDDYSTIENIYLMAGDNSSDSFDYFANPGDADVTGYYVVTSDGKKLVYLVANTESDYQTLYGFDLTSGSPVKLDEQEYKRSVFDYDADGGYCEMLLVDPDRMPLCSEFDLLASFTGLRYYHVGSDGMPASDDTYYYVVLDASQGELVAKTDLECQIVSSDDSATLSGESGVIKKGETFRIYRTDGESALDVWMPDGNLGRLTITKVGYPCEINGMVDTDCVEETMYAG